MKITEAQYFILTGEKDMFFTASRRVALMQFSFRKVSNVQAIN